ncbi:uncharacterized protein BX663DRAFT_439542 [Cokeromyces recurvatus]|uniref:uncharacterized protein n=1 Tax=Cokeromyces recurvatus TaxID=90255 RepID=UPI0022205533|nr:uncharacterized protein BX663DRAFT_439542 [Cokeromyces recurvatus]KAI7900392.1 hypothetical protein BX663DRAFT_439542 [Cokeromyces recurvatus]
MTTTNEKIKSMYDAAHKDAMNKTLKPGDMDKRLFLSALFDCPISSEIMKQYLVPIARLPENIISCIKSMEKAMDNNTIMNVEGVQLNSVEELALHHITLNIYLNHSINSSEWKSGENDFIARSVSCLFYSLWSPHDKVIVSWDLTTWINKQKMPDTVSSRPDMVFSTKLFEIGNGEVKPPNTSKASIDLARTRVLETCKRQLHLRLRNANSLREAVTFGVLIYGLSYEIYMVTFNDGYYPYARISVGLMSTSYTTYKCTEKMLMDLIQLKKSMNLSLQMDDNTNTNEEFAMVGKKQLLPTVSYSMILNTRR